ncbi:hypothetical protein HHL21_12130 [Massilia sp. RP-1-19]|uniref:Uncharacterized protein n=1 Tax=Massilia polaris TaxID=2728846 RepID=A0A848HT02_9BURK|nr:hypothetical protein [Massilia polaris]NML61808.1 hypothetical protein [Massilia polaris]
MDYEKMMLAVEVRKLAVVLYTEAFAEERSRDQSVTNHSYWRGKHSVMSFVPEALAQLEAIAGQISDHE